MSKFRVGDRVTAIKGYGVGRSGVIKEIESITGGNPTVHHVLLDGMSATAVYHESCIIYEGTLNPDMSYQEIYESTKNESDAIKPAFRVGNVVEDTYDVSQSLSYPIYVIKESIALMDDDENVLGYSYEVAPINSPDKSIIVDEKVLRYYYHDSNLEKYFTESVRNKLPAWRGELYNLYELYVDFNDPDSGFTNVANDYNNDTIPPIYMKHILDRHTIYGRINDVLGSIEKPSENKNIIMSKLKFSEEKIKALRKSIRDKIKKRNGIEYSQGDNIHFTLDETKLVEQIDLLDTESIGHGEEHHVDHFKLELRNTDIMKMIKQAYKSAQRVKGKEINQTSKDKRTEDVNPQSIGKVDYEGITRDGTVIRFTYDFDVDVIDTAYPLRMNNNVKKH